MGYKLNKRDINDIFEDLSKEYAIYAPKLFEGGGTYSDTNRVRYGEVKTIDDIVFDKKAEYSHKEVLLPISKTLFFFTEDSIKEADARKKGAIIFLRSCDLHAIKRTDDIYLKNGQEDYYYKRLRENTKFILMRCENSFKNCFCVSMGTNKTSEYDAYIKVTGNDVYIDAKDEEFNELFNLYEKTEIKLDFVTNNNVKVSIPENLSLDVMKSEMWKDYSSRCIASRIRVPGGYMDAQLLGKIQEISQKYGNGTIHITTRKGFEVPGIRFEEMDKVNELLQPIIEKLEINQ